METAAIITVVVAVFLCIIGLYVWTFKALGKLYKALNSHIQDHAIHTDEDKFAKQAECNIIHENVNKKLDEISKDVKSLLRAK